MSHEEASDKNTRQQLREVLPKKWDRLRFDGIMMLDFMGVYNTPYHQRPLQFLVEHADDSSEFSQEVIEDAKSRLEHIDYMVSRYPDYGKPVRRTSKD